MRSSIDFDGVQPVYENETGIRFSLGLQETQDTNIFAQNDPIMRRVMAAAVMLPLSSFVPYPSTPVQATPSLGFTESPTLLVKFGSSPQQQFATFDPQGPIYSITPQGWASESPQVRAKSYSAAQQQVVTFDPQGAIYSITPQGWTSESPVVLRKGFSASLQQTTAFTPQGPIYSITPQGWTSEHPQVRVKGYPASQQQFVAFGPEGAIYSITPQGWASQSPDIFARRTLADEQNFSSFEPEPPFTFPLGFTTDAMPMRRRPFIDVRPTSFPPFASVTVSVAFSPSPHITARTFASSEQQQGTFEPPTFPQAFGFVADAMLVKVKYRLDHQVTSLAPYQQAAPVSTITWGFVGPSPDVFVREYPASQQQFLAFNNFFGVRLFKGPPLIGKSTTPGITGVSAQALLVGKDTQPDISGVDAQATLIGTKSNGDLQASVDIDNSVALPLPGDELREDGGDELREDGGFELRE